MVSQGGAQPDASGGGGGGGGGGGQTDASGGGGGAALQITLTTQKTPNAVYAPNHVLAVWIENQGGTIVKTISRYADVRKVA
ncbi:MAG TPA: hypothetical protein VIV40_41920, partial [Kofleriaceae bacterium]